jgi:hypothetical protein
MEPDVRRRSFLATGLSTALVLAVAPLTPAQAATAAPTLLVLVYAGGAYPARPAGAVGGSVRYIGPTQPATWLVGDEWIQPSS